MANRMTRPVQLGFMSPQRANQLLLQGFPQPTATVRRTDQYYAPGGVVPPMSLSPAQQSAARAQANAALRPIMPLEASAMRRDELRTPPGPMQRIGQAFRQPLTSPTGQGLAAAALTGLDYAGPQLQPTSIGQGLARMGAAGLKAFTQAEQARVTREAAAEKARKDEEYRQQMLALKRDEISGAITAAEIKASAEAGSKRVDREMAKAKDFRTASKGFDAANANYGRVLANATTPNPSGSTDIAMIFNFMKMLDPTSVVRGSEYEAAAGAGSLLRGLGVQYNRLFKGEDEKLPPEVRQAFLQTATENFQPYVDAQELIESDFSKEAELQGLRTDRVITLSRIPEKGSEDYPHVAYTQEEANRYPVGSFVMLNGVIGKIK